MAEVSDLAALVSFLKRAKSKAEIEALSIKYFGDAEAMVTLTTVTSEGASGGGQVTCRAGLLLQACEIVLADLAGTTPSRVTYADFSQNEILT